MANEGQIPKENAGSGKTSKQAITTFFQFKFPKTA
jgi:hypothetical protein